MALEEPSALKVAYGACIKKAVSALLFLTVLRIFVQPK